MGAFARRALHVGWVTLLAYLLQTTVFRFFEIASVQPDLLAVAVIALCLDGDLYTGFCAGAWAGLLMDAMVGQAAIVYLLFYPLTGALAASIARRIWKAWEGIAFPFLVGPLVALIALGAKEGLMLGYTYLNGVDLSWALISRSIIAVVYSAALMLPVQWPVRRLMLSTRR